MTRQRTYLTALVAALVWLLVGMPVASAMPGGHVPAAAETLQATGCDRPQWEDLGLEDLLLPVSQPSVEAPTTLRHVHENAHYEPLASAQRLRLPSCVALRSALPHRAVPGYLYLLLCLRL